MSNGSLDQVMSLLRGGGALKGIGKNFSPDLYTGTGNFTVPITLPRVRSGLEPELSLIYSTGNGPFEPGWGLSVPSVSSQPSKGVPLYYDAEDTFVLSGAEDLVPVEHLLGEPQYRPRTKGLFACIHRRGFGGGHG